MIDSKTAQKCDSQGVQSFDGGVGRVYISQECIPRKEDATLSFDLASFLGMRSPTVNIA